MRPAESERRLSPEKGEKGDDGADEHTGAGSERRRPYTPAENPEKKELQHCAQYGHKQVDEQASSDIPADPQVIIYGKNDRRHRRTERVHSQVLHCQRCKISVGAHQPYQEGGGCVHGGADQHSGSNDHEAGTGKEIVSLLFLLFAKTDGNGDRRADADKIRQ